MSTLAIISALASMPNSMLQARMFRLRGRQVSTRSQSIFFVKTIVSILLLASVSVGVAYRYGFGDMLAPLHQLSPQVIVLITMGLLANALLAVLRFQVLASDAGHPIGWRRAMAAVGAGSLAGALFFQVAGQLMVRGVVMRRGGVPFAAVVALTLYERITAAFVSGLIAAFGAVHIFGRIYLDQSTGGIQLVMLLCGLAAAVGLAGLLGFGGLFQQHVWPLLTRRFVVQLSRVAGLTVLVQLPMMVVYVALAHQFSPQTSVIDMIAASAIVMFAASVPISLAGWGVRELSAVVALGAIGLPASAALTAAIIIGAGSLLAMGAIFAISINNNREGVLSPQKENGVAIDYTKALGWIVPLMASVFVLFQIYLPVGSGLLNVNLADPVVILGGSLFVLQAISRRQAPTWRIEYVNQFALLATLALGLSLLLGASRFGWTNWALINRFAGWFVLLAYATTGALITSTGGMRAVRSLAMSYAGATAGVVLVELTLLLLNALGFDVGSYVNLNQLQAFAQNHNFFAFQILMASGVVLVIDSGAYKKILLGIFLSGLWFAGSRSGWVSIVCMFVTALYLRRIDKRDLITAAGSAAALACLIFFLPVLEFHVWHLIYSFVGILHDWYGTSQSAASVFVRAPLSVAPQLVPTEASSSERMVTLIGGWKMFVDCPIFGAGLGAFRNLNILATSGIPLVIHSTALWLLAELGLVGFLIFAVPAIYVWVKEWRLAATDPAAAVIVLCFVGLAVMSGPADMLYQRTFWLIIGAALAVPRLSANNREQARATLRG